MDLFDAVSRSSIPWLPGFLVAFSNAASFTIKLLLDIVPSSSANFVEGRFVLFNFKKTFIAVEISFFDILITSKGTSALGMF